MRRISSPGIHWNSCAAFSDSKSRSDPRNLRCDLLGFGPAFLAKVARPCALLPNAPLVFIGFPPFDQVHGLVSCSDFISSAGTLCPIALCGRSSV